MWYLSSWRDLRRRSNAGHGLGNKPEITPPSHFYHRPDGTRWTSDFDTNAHHRRLFTAAAWRGLEPAPGSGLRRAFLHLSCSLCTIGQFIANLPFLRLRRTLNAPVPADRPDQDSGIIGAACQEIADLGRRVHASSLCIPKTSPQSALRSGPSLAQSGGSDSPDVSVTTPSIGPQTLMREPWGAGANFLAGRAPEL